MDIGWQKQGAGVHLRPRWSPFTAARMTTLYIDRRPDVYACVIVLTNGTTPRLRHDE
jgi:hypothetical protein